jgi:glutamate synthase domain-containing protein 2
MPWFATRYLALGLSLLVFLLSLLGDFWSAWFWPVTILSGGLSLVGLIDVTQTKQAIRRNYPILAHWRFFFETIRPELRQYLIESDTEEIPFARNQRAIVYQRAKSQLDKRPFGTQLDVYAERYEWLTHSAAPSKDVDPNCRITIGEHCRQPYSASVFNISAMSFGALSANAIRALNQGAKIGGFAHDTGEGSISAYHREFGGDLIWELGSGYFGCRDAQGQFDPKRFAEQAVSPQVKLIEIKLSQGAKPGHGGVLPAAKVTAEIAVARGVPLGQDCVSPAAHSAFQTPIELIQFVAQLRELSGGKPTGIKLAIGHPWEWFAMVKAMLHTGITPDFIVVDGGEGGTGAAPSEFMDHVGMPMRDALLLVHNSLRGAGLRNKLKIGAAGKIVTAFDIARTLALGADWCNAARGFMFALGCIQAQSCHTGRCPTGVTTQDPQRQRALVVPDKAERVANFHRHTLIALSELLAAAGLKHPEDIRPDHLLRRVTTTEVQSFAALYPLLPEGALLGHSFNSALAAQYPVLHRYWQAASPETFALNS